MWALVPLKNFAQAKQRLSAVLNPEERRGLFEAMAKDVLSILKSHPDIENTLVVSVDPDARQLATQYDAEFLDESNFKFRDSNTGGLNATVQAAVDGLAYRGIDEVMIIPGDVPLISADEISYLVDAHRRQNPPYLLPTLTIAPDGCREGTNCLLCTPATSIKYCYGNNSFALHTNQASHIAMSLQIVSLPGVSCDIDTPEDLAVLIKQADQNNAFHSHRYIVSNDLEDRLDEIKSQSSDHLALQYGRAS